MEAMKIIIAVECGSVEPAKVAKWRLLSYDLFVFSLTLVESE